MIPTNANATYRINTNIQLFRTVNRIVFNQVSSFESLNECIFFAYIRNSFSLAKI